MDDSQLIAALYAGVTAGETWPDALEAMAQATGGDGTLILPMQSGFDVKPMWSPSMEEGIADYQKGQWWDRDTRIRQAHALKMGEGVYSDVDFIGNDLMLRDPFYQDFLAPRGFGTMLCRLVMVPGGPLVSISVQRRYCDGLFEREERERFSLISQHAALALSAGISLAQASSNAAMEEMARRHRAHGYALLDGKGHVLFADDVFKGLFGSVFVLERGRIALSPRHRIKAFETAMKAVTEGASPDAKPPMPLALSRSCLRRDLVIRMIPIAPGEGNGFHAMVRSPRVMIAVHDLAADEAKAVFDLLLAVGLTPSQARVVETMAGGASARETAFSLGLSHETIRTTLRLAHDRLHVNKQTQLAALVATLRANLP